MRATQVMLFQSSQSHRGKVLTIFKP